MIIRLQYEINMLNEGQHIHVFKYQIILTIKFIWLKFLLCSTVYSIVELQDKASNHEK